jgi:hypothetical protein
MEDDLLRKMTSYYDKKNISATTVQIFKNQWDQLECTKVINEDDL